MRLIPRPFGEISLGGRAVSAGKELFISYLAERGIPLSCD